MSKEAVIFSPPSSFGAVILQNRRTRVSGLTRAWMRGVYGGEVVSSSAIGSLGGTASLTLKEANLRCPRGNLLHKSSLPGKQCSRKLSCVSQLTNFALNRRSSRRMIRMDLAGLDCHSYPDQAAYSTEGPSCIYVGPLEKAEKGRLEALYQQARDSYYSGRPLIMDDMFDRVETMLRWHGSKVVMKYPRCSLKRYSAYSDAEIDSSQMWALSGVWGILLAAGIVTAAGPPACAFSRACQATVRLRFESHGISAASEMVIYFNSVLAIGMGLAIGIPVAVAAARSLEGLRRGDLVAMKGFCPSCGEEVYAFIRADQTGQPQHKTECHVCEHPLMFRANVERSLSHYGQLWAYGRVYLSTQPKDLVPSGNKF
ncbi:hypothetical protein R1sor_006344 [Riccia sorocarpa]|uniref:PGR5-like protein 1A, chloroplastic n=1 Tax=Riccia sorocarpa TaxID=122646 RepID=A0ABD3HMQ8_9MARC